jgi:hypothetical protein
MPRHPALPLLLAALLLLAAACGSNDTGMVTATFALSAPEGDGGSSTLWNEQGVFDLQAFPAFVALTVTAEDMERESATWPESAADYAAGDTTVELTLEVPAGDARELEAVVFLFAGDRPLCFVNGDTTVLDLPSGSTREVTLDLVGTGTGYVHGVAPADADEIWLLDALTLVRLDRTLPDGGTFRFYYACMSRDLALAWLDKDGGYHYDPATTFHLEPDDKDVEVTLPQ